VERDDFESERVEARGADGPTDVRLGCTAKSACHHDMRQFSS
jgi:hypothetical protein